MDGHLDHLHCATSKRRHMRNLTPHTTNVSFYIAIYIIPSILVFASDKSAIAVIGAISLHVGLFVVY